MMMQQLDDNMSNLSSASGDLQANTVNSASENNIGQENGRNYHPNHHEHYFAHPPPSQSQPLLKKKRNLPGNPDPEAEVIALSPKTLMATNRFVCEICNKGFQRDQNLQLHRRGHNLPWKLKQRSKTEVVKKKVYVCPEVTCVHHEPSRALGDLTGIKKHFCRKHGEKKWKCDKCSKRYAVQSDWKAHSKTCGTREYRCDCGTLFSRRDSFITHRAFCDALAEESARAITGLDPTLPGQIPSHSNNVHHLLDPIQSSFLKKEDHPFPVPPWLVCPPPLLEHLHGPGPGQGHQDRSPSSPSSSHGGGGPTLIAYHPTPSAYMSATALLQKAAQMGTSHLSRGTSIQAPSTTSSSSMLSRPHHQPYQAHVSANSSAAGNNNKSDGTSGSSGLHPEEMISLDGACAGGPSPSPSSSSAFLHPINMTMTMMMNHPDGFADVSTFEDAFSQILDAKKEDDRDHDHHMMMMMHDGKSGNGGNINEGMTRDFLGLRAPSHGPVDILSIAAGGVGNHDTINQTPKPWHTR